MEKYNHKKIEAKWQKYWQKKKLYKTSEDKDKPKYYVLDMFPYPSGAGLHVGHPKGYIATDIFARAKMMQGFNVLHPMGWDAFGLPAENYAIANKIHPRAATEKNIATFKRQLGLLGFIYDWDREINTTDPEYYKWTQWTFLKMFERGLAYESNEPINWCPKCQTGLSNEDLEDGKCERCGSAVEKKPMRQWMLKITDYADRLLNDLEKLPDWEESIKEMQRNWIGRSEGAEVEFRIKNQESRIKVFTTRVDTIFGCTYVVLAPEHELVKKLRTQIENWPKVKKYFENTKKKSDLERTDLNKEKTGVKLEGVEAINPFNNETVPIFVADYVLAQYGTGAVMAVPAHDTRDWEFAKKYNLPVGQSVTPDYQGYVKTSEVLKVLNEIQREAERRDIKIWVLGSLAIPFYSRVIYRENNDLDLITENDADHRKAIKLFEELGFRKISEKKITNKLTNFIFKKGDIEIDIGPNKGELGLADDFEKDLKNLLDVKSYVISHRFTKKLKELQLKSRDEEKDKIDIEYLNGKVFTEDGFLVNSGEYNGLTSKEAREKMTAWLEKNGLGKKTVNYKLRDWVFSRQRYWGEPIPIVHCAECGNVAVPEKDLPVKLPEVKNYEPTGTGESPLANIKDWVNTKCPKCGGKAKRETNTMPQWAGSSWYYLRYIDPKNKKALVDKDKERYWSPVDFYVGGAEHATRHLIYARFWHKFLFDIGAVNYSEPFTRLQHVGLILAEDGRKMSKRWNNVVNPDEIVAKFGADAMRVYEMFMGPFSQPCAWSTNGVIGARRFLENVYKLKDKKLYDCAGGDCKMKESGLPQLLHKTIKKVTEDIENFHYNTAISQMMIFMNFVTKFDTMPRGALENFLKILAPFAPHLTEELWSELGHKKSIFLEPWPKYNPELVRDENINLVIQINGKVRDTIEVSADISEKEAEKVARESEKIKKWLEGKRVKKVIFVKGKLVNIVI